MSSFRRTTKDDAGDSIVYGANDFHIIIDLLNGTVSNIPPVKFKSSSGVKFWNGVLKLRDVTDTYDLTIINPALTTNRTLAFPNISSDDTLMLPTTTETLTNKTFSTGHNTITDTSIATGDLLKSNGTKFVRFARGTNNYLLRSSATDLVWASLAGALSIKLDDVNEPDNNTDLNATTVTHGLLPRLSGVSTNFLSADGIWLDPPGTLPGETNTMTNIGTNGVGVYKTKSGVTFQLKNINAGSTKITVTNDTTNNEIDIDLVEANLALTSIGGTLGIDKGGTGQTVKASAFDELAPTVNAGDIIYHDGTHNIVLPKGSANQVLTMNAGATAPEWTTMTVPMTLVSQDFTALNIVNTVTETNLFSYTIPANTLPDKMVEVDIETDVFGYIGSGEYSTLRVYYGATKIFDDAGATIDDSDVTFGYRYKFRIWYDATDDNNRVMGQVWSTDVAAPTTGLGGDFDQSEVRSRTVIDCDTNTEAITANKDFRVTIQHTSASSSFYVKRIYSRVTMFG